MDINYTVRTNKSFEEATNSLKESLKKYDFSVLWELNFKDKLAEKGLDFDTNFKVFECCNPVEAKNVLDNHIEAGFFLPCKIVIYEDNNSVIIGMTKPSSFMEMMNNAELINTAKKVETELISAINLASE